MYTYLSIYIRIYSYIVYVGVRKYECTEQKGAVEGVSAVAEPRTERVHTTCVAHTCVYNTPTAVYNTPTAVHTTLTAVYNTLTAVYSTHTTSSVYVCVCVCKRERECVCESECVCTEQKGAPLRASVPSLSHEQSVCATCGCNEMVHTHVCTTHAQLCTTHPQLCCVQHTHSCVVHTHDVPSRKARR